MKQLRNSSIIHLFALLHLTVALGCRAAGLPDDLLLTLLTMILAVVVSLSRQTTGMFMVISVIAVNVVGFALGWCTAAPLRLIFNSPLVIYPLSTFISTEIIGWFLDYFAKLNRKRHPQHNLKTSARSLRWMMVAFVIIIVIRLTLILQTGNLNDGRSTILGIIVDYVFSCMALVLIAVSAIKAGEKAEEAKAEAELAEYRYLKLKQQVNPHFLFNSLNVLDCLIQEQSPEEASLFTHKLADVYRYMIKNEQQTLVPLSEEMEFVQLYVDLLKVRWPEGIAVRTEVTDEAMKKSVVPCCVQLLIENATKHNSIRPDNPLEISITSDGGSLTVTNDKHPKVSVSSSTGIGLKYIRQQYEDVSQQEITVVEDERQFQVTLPLI